MQRKDLFKGLSLSNIDYPTCIVDMYVLTTEIAGSVDLWRDNIFVQWMLMT